MSFRYLSQKNFRWSYIGYSLLTKWGRVALRSCKIFSYSRNFVTLCKAKIQLLCSRGPPLLRKANLVIFPFCFPKTGILTILPFMPRSSKWSLLLRFTYHIIARSSLLFLSVLKYLARNTDFWAPCCALSFSMLLLYISSAQMFSSEP